IRADRPSIGQGPKLARAGPDWHALERCAPPHAPRPPAVVVEGSFHWGLARLIRVIDIETTGTDPASDAILEAARVGLVGGGGITNAMDTLVRPGKPIPPGASAVHHIVDEDVQRAPTLAEVIDRFRGADYYVAHNCDFERSFFAARGIELGPWICTYKC